MPPDDNATERLMRPLKVEMKVSGTLRSVAVAVAEVCLALGSTESAIEHGVDVVTALPTPEVLCRRLAIAE